MSIWHVKEHQEGQATLIRSETNDCVRPLRYWVQTIFLTFWDPGQEPRETLLFHHLSPKTEFTSDQIDVIHVSIIELTQLYCTWTEVLQIIN